MHPLKTRIRERLQSLLPSQGTVLAGISGGADSVALLALLAEIIPDSKKRLRAVHIHHGLRGKDADRDQALVIRLCDRLGISYAVYSRQVNQEAKKLGIAIEEAGRKARQACFLDAARIYKSRTVALAHHLDDQAETLLLNLLRGAGGQGLAAMRLSRPFPHAQAPKGLRLIRPLLEVSKHELESFLREQGISWRRDKSNRDLNFSRNRIRRILLPKLVRDFNPQIKSLLARSAQALARDDELLNHLAQRSLQRLAAPLPTAGLKLSRKSFNRLSEGLRWRVLALLWEQLKIPQKSTQHLERIMSAAAQKHAGLSLPGGWRLTAKADTMAFTRPEVKS